MSTISRSLPELSEATELHSGDRMTRQEFHRLYERMPEHFKAELIGGVVYVASPLRRPHGTRHPILSAVLTAYAGYTPGTEVCDNTTFLLADDSEPQPDSALRILPAYGGQTRDTPDEYIEGAPELIAEVAHSSRAIDLGDKRDDYARYGVLEYLVLSLADRKLFWFDLPRNHELQPDPDGILRVRTFPGLWIDQDALLASDYPRLMETVNQGLATPDHAAYVAKLADARR